MWCGLCCDVELVGNWMLEWSRFVGFLALTVSGVLKFWSFVVVFGFLLCREILCGSEGDGL
jgi:hypothetical protein